MLTGTERLEGPGLERMLLGLRVGDPDEEVLGAWLAKESVRDVYLADDAADAALLLDKAISGCAEEPVPEVHSLGRTLSRWRGEILDHHPTGASNGPTEGLNLLVKKVKRAGHGFRSFANYRLRILLHAGGVNWPATPPGAPHPNPLPVKPEGPQMRPWARRTAVSSWRLETGAMSCVTDPAMRRRVRGRS